MRCVILFVVNIVLAYIFFYFCMYRTDFCADSIIKRDLSNTLYARTRDYAAAQRLIDQTAATFFNMPLDEDVKFPSMKCSEINPYLPDYTHVFFGTEFLSGYITDTNLTTPIYSPPYDEYQVANESRRISTLNYLYNIIVFICFSH